MKKIVLLVSVVLLLAACDDPPVVGVNAIKQDVSQYNGKPLILEGVVSGWSSRRDPQLFAIADVSDSNSAKQFVIPVRFAGSRPEAGAVVRVSGKFDLNKREFVASKMEKR